jgi:hypothetical protein
MYDIRSFRRGKFSSEGQPEMGAKSVLIPKIALAEVAGI